MVALVLAILRAYSAPRAAATQKTYFWSARMLPESLVEITTFVTLLVNFLVLGSKSSSELGSLRDGSLDAGSVLSVNS